MNHIFKRKFLQILVSVISPFLGWGPVTHIYLHRKAVERLKGPGQESLLETQQDKDVFISAGNITDLIKANQLRFKERYYEYTHNTIPTAFEGQPIFGERLWEENRRLGRREGMIYSLGWICHQVSDQFPHRFPTDGYEGFVNSRKFFRNYYPLDENDYRKPVKDLRNCLISTDHWLSEIFADLRCYAQDPEYFRQCAIDLDFGDYPEIEDLSSRIIDENRDALYPAVKYFIPLKSEIMIRVFDYYRMLIRVFLDMYAHLYEKYGTTGINEMIDGYEPLRGLDRMIDYSDKAIDAAIEQPVGSWNPSCYLRPDDGEVRYSVYAYEKYDGPESYDFGFRRGLIPWVAGLFAKSRRLNSLGARTAEKLGTWKFVKPVMEMAKTRSRSGMNMTAYFICELDRMEKPDLAQLVEKTARRFRLGERNDKNEF